MRQSRRAVTLTELLVVLVIISLLATIAVPVYVQKAEQARVAITRAEVRAIAEAEEACALVHGFYVPMHTLDNIARPSSSAPSGVSRDTFEDDPDNGSMYAMNPHILLTATNNSAYLLNGGGSTDLRVRNMITYWQGPFLNPARVYKNGNATNGAVPNNPYTTSQLATSRDFLLDGWGRPYRLFSPIGITGGLSAPTGSGVVSNSDLGNPTQDDGTLTTNSPRFDRWAVCSFGSNGIIDGTTTTAADDDDIYYTFGATANESAYNAF